MLHDYNPPVSELLNYGDCQKIKGKWPNWHCYVKKHYFTLKIHNKLTTCRLKATIGYNEWIILAIKRL